MYIVQLNPRDLEVMVWVQAMVVLCCPAYAGAGLLQAVICS